jgi:hypothetical protein
MNKDEALKLALVALEEWYFGCGAGSISHDDAVEAIKQALAQPAPVQDLPFGVGGGLVAIKTLLGRDPCVHANTAIEMIDAILKEHPAAQPAVQEPVAQNNCIECANADSWGLPDKPFCRSCVSNSEWSPLNRSSVNPIPPPAQPAVQEPDELKHIGEQDSLLDVDERAWHLLVENRGGCRCHISPPCGACSNPISEEEMNEVGYTYTTQPAPQPVPVKTYHDGKPWPVAPKPWVGLTDAEIDLFINGRGDEDDDNYVEPTGDGFGLTDADLLTLVRRAEAKLKEKNHV